MLDFADLRFITERSAFLYERMSPRFTATALDEEEKEAARLRTSEWCRQAARGEQSYFEARLAWDGLDRVGAERLAGNVLLRDSEPLPDWVGYLAPVIDRAGQLQGTSLAQLEQDARRFPYLNRSEPVSFEHVFVPFVDCASERLRDVPKEKLGFLSAASLADLQRQLLKTLSWVARKTLAVEFSVWKAMPEPEFLATRDDSDAGRKLYSGFVQKMWANGTARLFLEYPVLARFLARACELWVLNVAEFLSHLAEDNGELAKRFNHGQPLGKIHRIETGLSDRHSLGKSVLEISFEAGTVCFYKPRNCKADHDFNFLLEWLNRNQSPLRFRTYALVSRSDHGWTEKVLHHSCGSEAEAQRYFQRAGMLMALLYALQASDINYENIISHGEFPVLIDAETLLQPRPKTFDTDPWGALEAANRTMYYDSVFRLSILPRWIARADGDKMDISAFGASIGRGYSKKQIWNHINTDQMSIGWERILAGQDMRGVCLGDRLVSASDYVEQILAGFEQMYRLLVARREDLWSHGGPLSRMHGFGTRFVFRNTYTYATVQDKCLAPQNLRDGMDTSICVDVLARRYAHSFGGRPLVWPVTAFEHASLLDLDIPRFEAPTDTDALQIGLHHHIQSYFLEPGRSILKTRFAQLDEDDLDLQKRFIRCSFAYFARPQCSIGVPDPKAPPEVNADSFVTQAIAIAHEVQEKSIRAPDGTVSWITQTYNMDSQFWQLQPIGLYFYDGVCGIGLFLAALEHVTGTTEFGDLMAAVLKVLEHFSSDRMRDFLEREGVGAGLGTPSLAYAMTRMGVLRDDPRLIDSAIDIAKLITSRHISDDRRLDTIGGVAGCLMVFRMLYLLTRQPWMLERAIECGRHLLDARVQTPSGFLSWPTIGGKFLAGFSHGAAGMISALAQLYELTSDERYRKAACDAQQYEESLFDETEQNWPNLLLPKNEGGFDFWNSWCHGAPGIGLARLGSSSSIENVALNRDIDRAIRAASISELHQADFVCCGNMGRIEVLVEASQKLGRPELLKCARELGARVVRRASENQRYAVGIKKGIYIPSFHQGMSGVGYQLLRLARPDLLPSALCWE